FRMPVRPELSAGPAGVTGEKSAIDSFIAARHRELGITPLDRAASHVQLRRLFLDLVGLPPSRDDLHSFLADQSPDAYERTADRLLASPAYGGGGGRHVIAS